MDTALKTDEEKKEFLDSPEELKTKVSILAQMILCSNHFIAFTGAGISTSAGIPDFRSGVNTILPTGPGAWEKLSTGFKPTKPLVKKPMLKALPTKTHMAFVQLEKSGFLKFLISQNVDGLHRRSGFPPDKLAELHGNTNIEQCQKCGKKYLRDYSTRNAKEVHDHRTGRFCEDPNCLGELHDTIINFSKNEIFLCKVKLEESLPPVDLEISYEHAQMSDLCIVIGTSCRVAPASQIPEIVGKKKENLVIVNLQATPLDNLACLKINGMADKVIEMVMEELQLPIPDFMLYRHLSIFKQVDEKKKKILIKGIDSDKTPYSFLPKIQIMSKAIKKSLEKEPFFFIFKEEKEKAEPIELGLSFYGHYEEEDYPMKIDLSKFQDNEEKIFCLEFSPQIGKWLDSYEVSLKKAI